MARDKCFVSERFIFRSDCASYPEPFKLRLIEKKNEQMNMLFFPTDLSDLCGTSSEPLFMVHALYICQ